LTYIISTTMRHRLLATLLICITPAAFAVQDCEFNGQSINTNNGAETAGKTGMVRCKDRDTGRLEREYELRNGDSYGLMRYYRDGKLNKEFTTTPNGPHVGLEREWAANGQLIEEFTNVNGNARGLRRSWYDSGAPKRVEFVADTEREGAAAHFTANKQLSELRCGPKPLLAPHVDDAALCGFGGKASTVSTFGSDGTLRGTQTLLAGVVQKSTRFYASGKPSDDLERNGTQVKEGFYAEDGIKRREKLWDESSRPALLLRDAEFHASGTLVRERLYTVAESNGRKRSRLALDARYFLNGQPQSKEKFTLEGSTEVREWQRFTDSGKLRFQGSFVADGRYSERAIGVHLSFFENGKTELENTYDTQGNIKRQRVWDADGTLRSDDELFEDGSRKAMGR
jgi:antitoxin component YwqK of YwqJK toxin-antitoxin module